MEKLTFEQVKDLFTEINEKNLPVKSAVAVFTEDSFNKPYTETERSYQFSSDNKVFKPWCSGYSIFASCLDGKDFCRIEEYIRSGEWKVEYCYLVD